MKKDFTFQYQLLGRLESDCIYYLGNGNRYNKDLWAHDEKAQIEKMQKIYKTFPITQRPHWINLRKIRKYAILMRC